MRRRKLSQTEINRNIMDTRKANTRGMPWTYAEQFSGLKGLEYESLLNSLQRGRQKSRSTAHPSKLLAALAQKPPKNSFEIPKWAPNEFLERDRPVPDKYNKKRRLRP